MMTTVIAFSGGRGSGKSSVSRELATSHGLPRAEFGDFVRAEARRRGIEPTPPVLQTIGQELVDRSPLAFVDGVLAAAGYGSAPCVIIDGVRHKEILDLLKSRVAPNKVLLVMLAVPPEIRKARLLRRGDNVSEFDSLESASTEVQINTALVAVANLVLDGTKPVADLAKEVAKFAGFDS